MIDKINILLNIAQKKRLILLLFLILTASLLEMLGVGSIPLFLGLLLDQSRIIELVQNISFLSFFEKLSFKNQIIYSGMFLLLFFTFKNIFLFFVNYYQSNLSKDLNIDNAKRLFGSYIFSSYESILKKNPAYITRNISADIINANLYLITLINLIREILLISVIFLLLIWVDFVSTSLIFILMVIFVSLFYFFVRTKIKELSLLNQKLRGTQIKLINQIFGSIKETKVYAKEKSFENVFNVSTTGVEKINFFTNIISKIPRLLIEVFFIIGILVIIFISITGSEEINKLIPTLTFLGVAVIRLMPAFSSLTSFMNALKKTEPSFNLITNELVELEKNSNNFKFINKDNKKNSSQLNYFENENIEFKNVFFEYEGGDKQCLKDVNMIINSKKTTAIVGKTGSGKTTLINLILGLLNPTKGDIFIGNLSLNKNVKEWQKHISIVPQDIYLLDDTIRNNIVFDNEQRAIDKKKLSEAIEKSKLKEFVSSLALKDNTIVGNQGVRLSGGQKQRIGIARALYQNKKILILDEATSSLDNETEKKLLDDLFELKGEIRLIAVTHRVNVLKNFDVIFNIKDNKVIELKDH